MIFIETYTVMMVVISMLVTGGLQSLRNGSEFVFSRNPEKQLSSRADLVEPFRKDLLEVITSNGLTMDMVFNADETGLFWKLLPDYTYVHAGEAAALGRKTSKERFTFLACANASGLLKLRPLVIGKAKKPRSFLNKCLPVDYAFSKSAWMTVSIFKKWFMDNFVPQV